mgnify:FL=1
MKTESKKYLFGLFGAFLIGFISSMCGLTVFKGGFHLGNFIILTLIIIVWVFISEILSDKIWKSNSKIDQTQNTELTEK